VLSEVRGIAITHFTSADVVRHPLVARIVEAYDAQSQKDAALAEASARASQNSQNAQKPS
jgi:phosphate starvation-inducible protein PhoH and related proteins